MDEFKGISIDPLARKMEFFHGNQRGFDRISQDLSPTIAAIGPNVAWFEQKEETQMQEDPKVRCIASCRPERSWQGIVKNQDRIYDPDGISPALHCCGGGNLEPKIMQIGSYSPSSACNAKVLDTDGICPTLLDHKGAEPAIIEPLSCAMRGRNPDCPSDHTARINTKQRLEIGSDVANCVTTVQKDSMVIEPAVLTPIRTEKAKELRRQGIETFANRELVPRTDGCSGTITTVQKDNLLQEPIKIRQATAQGYIECPAGGGFDAAYPNSKLRRGRVQNNGDVVGAITASADNHCVYEGVSILGYTRDDKGNVQSYHEKDVAGTIHTSSGNGGNTDQFVKESISRQDNIAFKEMPDGNIRAYDASTPDKRGVSELQITNADNIAPTLTTSHEPKVLLKYRIRKLTPTECLRLMDCDDEDIQKILNAQVPLVLKSGKLKYKQLPKTAAYKLAGNSICVAPLYYIFRNMFIPEYQPKPKPQIKQYTIFDYL